MKKVLLAVFTLTSLFTSAQLTLNQDIAVSAQRSVDGKQYKIVDNKHVPYADTADFLATVPPTRRHIGEIAYIYGSTTNDIRVWQFVGGIAGVNLRKQVADIVPTETVSTLYTADGNIAANRNVYLGTHSLAFQSPTSGSTYPSVFNNGVKIGVDAVTLGSYDFSAMSLHINNDFKDISIFSGPSYLLSAGPYQLSLRAPGSLNGFDLLTLGTLGSGKFNFGGSPTWSHIVEIEATDSNALRVVAPLAVGATTDSILSIDILGRVHKIAQVISGSGSTAWGSITGSPTTLAGYGITDAAALAHTHTFSSLTSKPTTIAGYGITDAETALGNPAANGYILSSTTAGVRSWIATPAGTLTGVSVTTANGFSGSSSGGATPAITITTNLTGLLKGNGAAMSAAVAGTDYLTPTGSAAALTSFPTFNQNTTGSAAKWTNGRTLSLTGEVIYTSPTIDGTANVTAAATISNAAVIAKLLTGYTPGSGTVASTDNILQAIQKIDGNSALKAPSAYPTFSGHVTVPTATSATDAVNLQQLKDSTARDSLKAGNGILVSTYTDVTLGKTYPSIAVDSSRFRANGASVTLTSGSTYTVADSVQTVKYNPSNLQSTLTITLPANPQEGQPLTIIFGGTIAFNNPVVSALTISANTGQTLFEYLTPSFANSKTSIFTYKFTNSTWVRL